MATTKGTTSIIVAASLSVLVVAAGCDNDKKKQPPAPTATRTSAAATATATPLVTPTATTAPEEPTATATAIAPTATRTNTAVAPAATVTATPTSAPTATATATGVPRAQRASKSSSIALSADDAIVVMVNPDADSISIFETSSNTLIAEVSTGDEPSSVVIAPDGATAFVANRAAGTVVKVSNVRSGSPVVSAPLPVGSEPTSLALGPTGEDLFVAEFAQGAVTVIHVGSAMNTVGEIETVIPVENPRAVAVTNDGDDDGHDETLIVTQFFGAPNPDVGGCPNGTAEVCDTGRLGHVRLFDAQSYQPVGTITFNPIDSGFTPSTTPGAPTVMTAPNQLYAVATRDDKVYVTSVSASPQGPINFQANVFPVLYVGTLDPPAEDGAATANVARLVRDVVPDGGGTDSFFMQEIVDLDLVAGSTAAWVVSRAADAAQQLIYDPDTGVPTASLPQVDLGASVGAGPCQNPTGIVTATTLGKAYVNCWITRRLGVIDLADMALETTVQATALPAPNSAANRVRLGARFYFTGRTRWSEEGEGYSSCGSCHPDGLTDGITWAFAAGPRQTTSMDGSFSHGAGGEKQRIFNWTAIFDEVHDFERNTRGVSGGLGAITMQERPPDTPCTLSEETRVNIDPPPPNFGNLGVPVKEIQDTTADICTKDWDDVFQFVKTIRPPKRVAGLDPESVARGREIFREGQCANCHGGAGWTVSRRYWEPSSENNADLMAEPFFPPNDDPIWPQNPTQISIQPASADPPNAIAPDEVACVLRNVGTFGIPGDESATNLIEVKVNGTRAEGRGGFNVPSLYGMSVNAPYFHHGQAATLNDVFSELWEEHYKAGNPDFELDDPDRVQDLVSFLLSIDANTLEEPFPNTADACPPVFPPGEIFHADLDGDQEVPDPGPTDATGEALFFVSGDEQLIYYDLGVEGIEPGQILQAHIHAPAPPGETANVVVFLASRGFASPIRGALEPSDLIPNASGGILGFSDFLSALRDGSSYVNVHTLSRPAGLIRGQIRRPSFTAQLSGNQEVPPVTTDAGGEAVFFTSPDGASMSFVLNVYRLAPTDILFAHIHVAPPGMNGNPVVFLSHTAFASPLIGRFSEADIIPGMGIDSFSQLLETMEAGDTYANVHSQAHIGGEVRGQIEP